MYVERRAPIMRRMVSEGHQVGNHTWDHYRLPAFPPAVITSEIQRTNDIVQQITGVRPTIMRPPYGETNPTIMSIASVPQILWSIDTDDWRDRNSAVIAQRVIDSASPGAIILLHDIYPTSVDAVPAIIDGLRAKGLEPVTIDELLDKPTEVREYRHR
jgi:peptidoglycan/xylan/chitin deacetylase (PgdA/CDA1 family)